MIESAERRRAGDEQAGQPCGWCGAPLGADDQVAVCAECSSLQHEACWDGELGCAQASCLNAPLPRLDQGAARAAAAPDEPSEPDEPDERGEPVPKAGRKKKKKHARPRCVGCHQELSPGEDVCEACFAINTPDGLYHGPTKAHPLAREAFIMALVGLFFCGPILGAMAIGRANKAKAEIRRDPRLSGDGLATAALVLAIIDIALWGFALLGRAGGSR